MYGIRESEEIEKHKVLHSDKLMPSEAGLLEPKISRHTLVNMFDTHSLSRTRFTVVYPAG